MSSLKITELFSHEDDELKTYAQAVRKRIELKIGDIFPNKNSSYTSVIISEFLRAAQNYVHIYCGGLNGNVYQLRRNDFEAAINRGVTVQVLTFNPFDQLGSPGLAEYLIQHDCLRQANQQEHIPHFVDADGIMYRLETSEEEKTAIVCAYARGEKDKYNQEIINNLQTVFDKMWAMSVPMVVPAA